MFLIPVILTVIRLPVKIELLKKQIAFAVFLFFPFFRLNSNKTSVLSMPIIATWLPLASTLPCYAKLVATKSKFSQTLQGCHACQSVVVVVVPFC